MLKNFAFITVTGLLASACVIDIGDTLSASASDTNESSGSTGTSGSTSTTESSTTSTTEGTSSTTTSPTTTEPTTSESGTTGTTTDGTTGGGGDFGNCGWNAEAKYYACPADGGVPSMSDPDNISPIACPDVLPAEGEKCDEESSVTGVGCCTPQGVNYYCAEGAISIEDCGA